LLRLHLEPGQDLERTLQASASQFSKLLEEAVKEGFLRIRAYPRVDSMFAGGVIASIATTLGIKPIFKVSINPPDVINIPTIILGYKDPEYKSAQVSSLLYSVSIESSNPPPPGAIYITGEGSVAGQLGLILVEAKGAYVRRELLQLLLSATYYGGYVEKTGRFHGLDRIFYESMIELTQDINVINTLKIYDPDKQTLCEGISRTVDPYYPGLTGDSNSCKDLLKANELESLEDRIVSSLSEKELEKAALAILSHIQSIVDTTIEAGDYVGSIIVFRGLGLDSRLLINSFLHYIDSLGDYSTILNIIYSFDQLLRVLPISHQRHAHELAEYVETVKPVKAKLHSWIRGYMVRLPEGFSPLILWRALRLTGKVGDDLLIIDKGDKACLSALQVEEAKGLWEARKLVRVKAAVEEGLWLCLKKNAQQ